MINKWMNLLHEDLESDPWLNEETADVCTENAAQTEQDDPWLREETENAARKRSVRRSSYSFALRAVAFFTIFIFAMNALPTRMVARAGDETLGGNRTASDIKNNYNMGAGDTLTLDSNMTLTLDDDLDLKKIVLGGHTLTVVGPGTLTVDQGNTQAHAIIYGADGDNSTLIIQSGTVNANCGSTSTAIEVKEIQIQTGNGARLNVSHGSQGGALILLNNPLQTDGLTITTNPGGVLGTAIYGGKTTYVANGAPLRSISISASAAGGAAKKESEGSGGAHTHNYVWKVVKEATEDESGEEDFICEGCGSVLYRIPLTAAAVFCKNTVEKIKKAPANGTVEISTKRWNSFHYMVRDALLARPDVTLRINFLSEGYKGTPLTITIPAGYDVSSLFDSNGYMGFLFAGSKLGYN